MWILQEQKSTCPSSALLQQLRSLLCIYCHALQTNKNPSPVVELIPCAFLNFTRFIYVKPLNQLVSSYLTKKSIYNSIISYLDSNST